MSLSSRSLVRCAESSVALENSEFASFMVDQSMHMVGEQVLHTFLFVAFDTICR